MSLLGDMRRKWLPRSPAARAPATPDVMPAPGFTPLEVDQLRALLALVNEAGQPNINPLTEATRNLDILTLNVKALGYSLARRLSRRLPPPTGTSARKIGIKSKLSTQRDLESPWLAHWCAELGVPLFYHRKLWEYGYVLQAVYEHDMLEDGVRALGFGCGTEPIASYFARHGMRVTITDLAPEDDRTKEWSNNNEYAASLEHAHHEYLVPRARFEELVDYRNVDMNAIPGDLRGYDLCWSICAFEHLGSIEHGLAFVENAMVTLRPGGVAIHTTEYNVNPDGPTVDNWMTVLFQRKHMEALAARLRAHGHHVATFDFDPGSQPLDQFVDMPPWHDHTLGKLSAALGQPQHLKLAIDGFVATCIGIIVTKAA